MNKSEMSPRRPVTPVPASELEREAESRGIESDEAVEGDDSDTHLPASEAELLKEHEPGQRRAPTITPPPPD